ncbi:kinase-like domain-containing protein [Bisporella sp. PMI_857]|nr:kinase-like domain-containing protein [Bisporella sp. PMI_857]
MQWTLLEPLPTLQSPLSYNNSDNEDIANHEAGVASLEHEKAIYQFLKQIEPAHHNIIRCFLIVPQGIFLERLATTLEFRNRNREQHPVSEYTVVRWTRQLVSAVAFLEQNGLIHGNLRPANILISKEDHIKLADFGDPVKVGERLRCATPGFSQVSNLKTFSPCIASCGSEQLAVGSCIFAISTGTELLQDAADQVQRFYLNDFPSTKGFMFGSTAATL